MLILTPILVLVAGLEPARYLYRGILRHMRQKPTLTKNIKIRAFSAENRLKMPQKSNFSVCYKILKISNFPKLPKNFHRNFWYISMV